MSRFDPSIIHTDANGRPIPRPDREDFGPGIEGTIAYMRAVNAYHDQVTDMANRAFTDQFRKSVK